MIPVVTPAEMQAIDHGATDPIEVLIDRAGRAVARAVIRRLGGVYGRRVVVVAGPGNNGGDGRVAAAVLARRGVRVAVVEGDAEAGRVSFEVTEHDGATHGIDMVGVTHGSAGPDGFAALHPIKLYTSGTLVCELRARGLVLDVLWDDFAIGGVAAP